jgi:hypothetical protein
MLQYECLLAIHLILHLLNARSNATIRVAISYSFDFAFTKRS